jgi:hypothetical protein
MSKRFSSFFFGLLLASSACSEPEVPGGRITIRNDILDKEYNTFTVDQVLAGGSLSGFRKVLRPTQAVTIPFKHISSLRFTRQYEGYSLIYVVDCPDDIHTAISMNLIDVHSNRLGGGCVLSKRGEIRNGVTTWEKE